MTSDTNHNNIILNIQYTIGPDNWEFAWTKLADEMKKSIVSRILKTSFHTNISLENVKDICRQLINNYENTIVALKNHHSPHPDSIDPHTNLCLSNFLRDIMEIDTKTMIIMKEYLDECKCCEQHTTVNMNKYSCPCICKKMSITLKTALTDEEPLQVKGKYWKKKKFN
jgi:hypothetical protein